MGDRANVYIHGVYLYTHWGGSDLPETVRTAIARAEDRWQDDSYLARVIFCEMVKGHEESTSGFGIGTRMPDNDGYPVLFVCCKRQAIGYGPEGTTFADEWIPFQDFANAGHAAWPKRTA